jgi:hypothetical protein
MIGDNTLSENYGMTTVWRWCSLAHGALVWNIAVLTHMAQTFDVHLDSAVPHLDSAAPHLDSAVPAAQRRCTLQAWHSSIRGMLKFACANAMCLYCIAGRQAG